MQWRDVLLALVFVALINLMARADTVDVKMAFDFRDNKWKSIEFIQDANKNYIRVYSTLEDITNRTFAKRVQEREIFYIKEKDGFDSRF